MAYNIKPPDHLIATAQGRKFAVWGDTPSGLFAIGVFEYKSDGWAGVWVGPLMDNAALDAEIKRAGDMKKWLAAVAQHINTVIRNALGSAAIIPETSGSPLFAAVLNEINANWKMTVGADGVPVFGPK